MLRELASALRHSGDPAAWVMSLGQLADVGFQPVRAAAGTVMAMADAGVIVWYNPRCSKCRGAEELLAEHGVPAHRVFYLDDPPARDEITRVLALLGTADPRTLMRTAESRYAELGLAEAAAGELIDAMARHPERTSAWTSAWPSHRVA